MPIVFHKRHHCVVYISSVFLSILPWLFQGVFPHGALPVTIQWTAQMIQLMRSWRGLLGQPLRGPVSGRNLGRGDDPEPTENHVSHVSFWLSGIINLSHREMQSAAGANIIIHSSSCVHSEEDTEERSDNRGGKCSRLVQWFRDAGVSWTWGRLEALSLPLQRLHPTWQPTPFWLGTKIPSPALMSWPHLHAFGSHKLDTSASWREWRKGFIHGLMDWWSERAETERCIQTTKLRYCWINIDDVHSQGLIMIILRTWHCIQTPTQ